MKHKVRVRNHVFSVAWQIAQQKNAPWYGFFTVGEVAPVTEYSRPTVQKYIDMLVDEGLMECIKYEKSTRLYRFLNIQ